MSWTIEQIESVMNYMRVCLGAEKIFMFYLNNDRIGYYTSDGKAHARFFSAIYEEMLDKQKEL